MAEGLLVNYRNAAYNAHGTIDCEINHPRFGWIPTTLASDDPDTTELFATVSAGTVSPAPEPILAEVKAAKLEEINAAYTTEAMPLVKSYPEIERLTWPLQQAQATAYQAWLDAGSVGEPPPTPTLDPILAGRNGAGGTETMAELVEKVLANAVTFNAWQQVTGKRHRLEKAIKAAATLDKVQAITW